MGRFEQLREGSEGAGGRPLLHRPQRYGRGFSRTWPVPHPIDHGQHDAVPRGDQRVGIAADRLAFRVAIATAT